MKQLSLLLIAIGLVLWAKKELFPDNSQAFAPKPSRYSNLNSSIYK